MKRIHLLLLSFCLVISFLLGCEDDPPPVEETDFSNGTWILNEGTFNWGNASLSYLSADGKATQNVFSTQNDNLPLGDVAQSLTRKGTSVDLMINNSGKIFRVNAATLKVEKELGGLVSPRFLLPVSTAKAYVSDLYGNKIHVLDYETLTLTGEIPTAGWTEEMLLHDGMVYVTLMGSNQVLLVDPGTDQIVDSITVGREPNSLVIDQNDMLWVLCSGGVNEVKAELVRVDLANRSVASRYEFPDLTASPTRLEIDKDGAILYYLDGGVFAMEVGATALPNVPLIAGDQHNFYNLHLNGSQLWVTDAVDFVQSGSVLQYQLPGGAWVASHATGAIPSEILFLP